MKTDTTKIFFHSRGHFIVVPYHKKNMMYANTEYFFFMSYMHNCRMMNINFLLFQIDWTLSHPFYFIFLSHKKFFSFFSFLHFFIFIPRLLQNEHSSNIFFSISIFFFHSYFFYAGKGTFSSFISANNSHMKNLFSFFW